MCVCACVCSTPPPENLPFSLIILFSFACVPAAAAVRLPSGGAALQKYPERAPCGRCNPTIYFRRAAADAACCWVLGDAFRCACSSSVALTPTNVGCVHAKLRRAGFHTTAWLFVKEPRARSRRELALVSARRSPLSTCVPSSSSSETVLRVRPVGQRCSSPSRAIAAAPYGLPPPSARRPLEPKTKPNPQPDRLHR